MSELSETINFTIGIFSAFVGMLALVLYMRDKQRVEPVILQTFVRRPDNSNLRYHQIQALVVNNGEKKAENCYVELHVNGNNIGLLDFVPVDSPIGRVGIDWEAKQHFDLYSKIPIWVRRYLTVDPNDKIKLVLKQGGTERFRTSEFTTRFQQDEHQC